MHPLTEFWKLIKQDFEARIIVIDFKNYSEEIDQKTIHSVSKYINSPRGKFDIVVTKNGINQSCIKEQRIKLFESKQLILHLNNQDIIEMIYKKMNDEIVEEVLERKYNVSS